MKSRSAILAVAAISILVVGALGYYVVTQPPSLTFAMVGMTVTFSGNASDDFVGARNCTDVCGMAEVGSSITLQGWNIELSENFNCTAGNLDKYSVVSITAVKSGAFVVTNVSVEYVGEANSGLPAFLPYWNTTPPAPYSICLGDIVPAITFTVIDQGPTTQELNLIVSVDG